MSTGHAQPSMFSSRVGRLQRPLLVLVGPTAVGKTALSLRLATALQAEIVSADSRLLYRGMDIGTAKPDPEARRQVPHHLIDVAAPDEVWTVARFQEAAYRTIAAIHARGRLPLLVGGTGQYVWAVVEGWQVPRVPPQPQLRALLEQWGQAIGPAALHSRLARLDPEAAARIAPTNLRRIVRALEVIFITGQRFSAQRQRRPPPYQVLILGLTLPRAELHRRIRQRLQAMLSAGWIEEVRRLLAAGYTPDLPAMSGIGYAELCAYLRGECSLAEAEERILRRTHILVRRQANWFKQNDSRIHWFQADAPHLEEAILDLVKRWLEGEYSPPPVLPSEVGSRP